MPLIKLNKNNYEYNLNHIALKAGGFNKIICVLKDNAYGHGVDILSPLIKSMNINFVAVKNESEANKLVDIFDNILILSHIPNGNENHEFIYAINDINHILKFRKNTKIHLKIDTNMHRNGILVEDLNNALDLIQKRELKLEGVFTHFLNSDEIDGSFFVQKQIFNEVKKYIKTKFDNLIFHSHNSSALFRDDFIEKDEMCRVGLAQFGYNNFDNNLKKVMSLHAFKLSSRILKKGQSVGYGGVYTATKDINIATYDIGYGDGLLRYNGLGDLFLANNEKMLGKMSMDSFCSKDCGDEICVFKDVSSFAKFFNTIEYDILVKLSPYIDRILI